MSYYIYIMSNRHCNTFYIGVTNDLIRRVSEHHQKIIKGFTEKYNLVNLVYYEIFEDIMDAVAREKQLKNWHRLWKINLIKTKNPLIEDLYEILK
ncbi:GIY-YIG nuclease family protein [Candidatus Microgenomates bacterium]|nr:GIY-YIG nuclease family protein [Candidatus Microgenomates bacterium]